MTYTIYKLTNTADNGKSYIGQTTNPTARFHKALYKGYRIKRAIEKFGWNSFTKEVLAQTEDKAVADQLETGFIQGFNTRDPDFGYNAQRGGTYSREGFSRRLETTERQRETMHRIRWFYNPKTNETIRILPEAEIPSGFVPGRGAWKPTNPFGRNH